MNNTLSHVKAFLDEEIGKGSLDTYAVLLSRKGQKYTAFSKNANENTLFDMASCGKMLVTTPLILQAISRKKISLSDTLSDFFDGVPNDIRKVTVEQLLTHTSGIVRSAFAPESAGGTREVFLKQIFDAPRPFAPGTDYRYSCHGMILLGFILETVYEKPLATVFEENLKQPLGYTRSRFNVDFGEENTAVSYHWNSDTPYPFARPWDDENIRILGTAAGSGGQFFTLSDIGIYADAILKKDARLYDGSLFALAERDHTPAFSEGRGLGYWIADSRFPEGTALFSNGTFGHIGSTGTSVFLNRNDNAYMVILTNMRRFSEKKCGSYAGYMDAFFHLRRQVYENAKCDLSE